MKRIIILVNILILCWTSVAIGEISGFKKLTTVQLMALAIYGESRSESFEGKLAVGTVIMERYRQFNRSVKQVILDPMQFSSFNEFDGQYATLHNIAIKWKQNYKNLTMLRECYIIATGLLNGTLPEHQLLANNSVTHFKTADVRPRWSVKLRYVCTIGNHQFYTMAEKKKEKIVGADNIYKNYMRGDEDT